MAATSATTLTIFVSFDRRNSAFGTTMKLSGRNLTFHRDPIEYAIGVAVVVDRVMHCAAIVPHHDVAHLPHVAIHVVGLCGVRVEEIKQRPALLLRHALDLLRCFWM